MYREVLELSLHRRHPDFEVLLAPPGSLGTEIERFGPHVLIQDADEAEPTALPDGVLCRIRILKTGSLDATIDLDGTASEVRDVLFEDLFVVLEKAERLTKGEGSPRAADPGPDDHEAKATRRKDGGA
jgi:hypothetical protein